MLLLLSTCCCCQWFIYIIQVKCFFWYADWHAAGQEGEGEDWEGAWTMIDCCSCWLISLCRLTRCWTGRRRRRLSGRLDYDWLLLLLIDCCVQIDTLLDRKEKEKTEREPGLWLIAALVDWFLCADWHAAGPEGEGEDWAGAWTGRQVHHHHIPRILRQKGRRTVICLPYISK